MNKMWVCPCCTPWECLQLYCSYKCQQTSVKAMDGMVEEISMIQQQDLQKSLIGPDLFKSLGSSGSGQQHSVKAWARVTGKTQLTASQADESSQFPSAKKVEQPSGINHEKQ